MKSNKAGKQRILAFHQHEDRLYTDRCIIWFRMRQPDHVRHQLNGAMATGKLLFMRIRGNYIKSSILLIQLQVMGSLEIV